jgi:hypothetical protein
MYTVRHHSYSLIHQLGRRTVKVFFYGREAPLSFLIREVKTSATIWFSAFSKRTFRFLDFMRWQPCIHTTNEAGFFSTVGIK